MREPPMSQTRRDVVRCCATLAVLAAASGWLLACGDERAAEGPAAGQARPRVVVSVLPQAWFVDRIADDHVQVVVMIPPGADPATLSPGFAELRSLAEAALYVKLGHPAFPFERAWLDEMVAANEALRVLDLSLGIELVQDDPHYWVSPRHAHAIAAALASALAEILPASRDQIDANRRRLDAEIDAVDALLSTRPGATWRVSTASRRSRSRKAASRPARGRWRGRSGGRGRRGWRSCSRSPRATTPPRR
jgi:ABC-type Zn uptake system ZnuABC Zn-binding protein ZnuA